MDKWFWALHFILYIYLTVFSGQIKCLDLEAECQTIQTEGNYVLSGYVCGVANCTILPSAMNASDVIYILGFQCFVDDPDTLCSIVCDRQWKLVKQEGQDDGNGDEMTASNAHWTQCRETDINRLDEPDMRLVLVNVRYGVDDSADAMLANRIGWLNDACVWSWMW